MLCATCGRSLEVAPVEGAEGASVVLSVGSRPLPLRCRGCAKVVCHACQSRSQTTSEGVTAAVVATECPFCGDLLELVRGEAPAPAAREPEPPPPARELSRDVRKALKRAYKQEEAIRSAPERERQLEAIERLRNPDPGPTPSGGGCGGAIFVVGLIAAFVVHEEQGTLVSLACVGGATILAFVVEGFRASIRRSPRGP